jgi:hypothetical protein
VRGSPLNDMLDMTAFDLGQRIEYVGHGEIIPLAERFSRLRVAPHDVRCNRPRQREEFSHRSETASRF